MGKINTVMSEYASGKLHSGSKSGPKVTSRKQAIAIGLSEERRSKMKRGMNKSKRMGPPQLSRFK